MYSVAKLAKISGVSTRTIRYYDQINLLKPSNINSNGYREYSDDELDSLQQILYFKNLGFNLDSIKTIMDDPNYNIVDSLEIQKQLVTKELTKQKIVLKSLDWAIKYYKGEKTMSNSQKFEAFKQDSVDNNEKLYGDEVRKKYGEKAFQESQTQFGNLTEQQYSQMSSYEEKLIADLNKINAENLNIDSATAKDAFENHKKWLKIVAPKYSPEYHLAMADLYEADSRFAKYYDSKTEAKSANLLVKIIRHFLTVPDRY